MYIQRNMSQTHAAYWAYLAMVCTGYCQYTTIIQQIYNFGSAYIQVLLAVCQKFAMLLASDNTPNSK